MSHDDDDSDSKSYKFDVKNSFTEEKLRQEIIKTKNVVSNEVVENKENVQKRGKLIHGAHFEFQGDLIEATESYANSNRY